METASLLCGEMLLKMYRKKNGPLVHPESTPVCRLTHSGHNTTNKFSQKGHIEAYLIIFFF